MEMDATNYAKSPADIKATAEMIAATYSFNEAILAGAICSALVMERERWQAMLSEALSPSLKEQDRTP